MQEEGLDSYSKLVNLYWVVFEVPLNQSYLDSHEWTVLGSSWGKLNMFSSHGLNVAVFGLLSTWYISEKPKILVALCSDTARPMWRCQWIAGAHHLINIYSDLLARTKWSYFHWDRIRWDTGLCWGGKRQYNASLHGGHIFSVPRDVFLRSWGHLMGWAQWRTVWSNHIHGRVILVWLKASLSLFPGLALSAPSWV